MGANDVLHDGQAEPRSFAGAGETIVDAVELFEDAAVLGAGLAVLATATPALAAQDPAHPRATVTRGPSCAAGACTPR